MVSDRLQAKAFVVATLLSFAALVGVPRSVAQVSILTNKMDNSRTGQNINETLLTTTNVNPNQFGKLFAFNVDGYVQAQPLYMSALNINGVTHNVVFVATQHDSVYAIDADTGVQIWQISFLNPAAGITSVPYQAEGCNNITGLDELGITGTPVIDPTSGTIYVTAKTQIAASGKYSYEYNLHALDVTTGLEKFGGPVQITGQIGTLSFAPLNQIQRPGLLLLNDTLWVGSGSNGCDLKARGWLFAYNATTLEQVAQMTTQPDNSYGSSLWQAGIGPAADTNGNVFLSTANGLFNYSAFDYGDSVLKLTLSGSTFTVDDYFTPFDQANMAATDTDLGSGGVTLLPTQTGSSTPDLLVTSGKAGNIYLINRDNLGMYNTTSNDQIVEYLPAALGGEFFGGPVYWNNMVYFLAHQDYLRGYALGVSGGKSSLSTTPVVQTAGKLTNIGLPVVSANGTTNGIVWLVRAVKSVSLLSAYDATNLFLLYDSSMAASNRDSLGTIAHHATPIVTNGKVYAGTETQLVAYGLFPAINPAGGNNQTGYPGTTLPMALGVVATNPYTGKALSGVTVTFSDGGVGGTFSNPTAVTNGNGQATSTYTLPNTPQTVTITVSSPGYATAMFTENDVANTVASISFVSGTKQIATVGTTLPLPLIVKAKNSAGTVVVGASVTFVDNGAGGTFSPNPAITNSGGQATTSYTLSTVAQAITVTASVGPVTANASEQSTAGPAASLNYVQGNNQSAPINTKLPKSLGISVTDKYGNGVSGLTVNFTDNGAGGIFNTTAPITNTHGQAAVTYTTPGKTGTVKITATYSTFTPVTFTETVN